MSGTRYLDALASERVHNATLLRIIFGILLLGAAGIWFAWREPKNIDLHLAPDIRAGDAVRIAQGLSPVPAANVYGFAYYIWQQINRWQSDGAKDYGQQIFNMQYFLTPQCQAQLTADMDKRSRAGELRKRTRVVTEIPGFSYNEKRVVAESTHAWTVLLDLQVMESFSGQSVKDVFIRYPIRVVRFDVDRERNPWQLAIDCYGGNRPARLDEADLRQAGSKQLTVPELPSSIAPAALPEAAPIEGESATSVSPNP
jgi:integrating conjugative element protein (TIGR03746 family)